MKRNKKIETVESEIMSETALVDTTKIKVGTDNAGLVLATAAKELKNVEDLGTAAIQTGLQFTLAIEDILANEFGFTDSDLKKLEGRLKVSLSTLAQLESKGFNILSINDMKTVGEIRSEEHTSELQSR